MARGVPGFFDVDERMKELAAKGGDLELIKSLVDFELFRPVLETAVQHDGRERGDQSGQYSG